jgi:hypothetical protein
VAHPAEQLTIENQRLAVTLASEANQTVVALRDAVTGRDLLAVGSTSPLFQLQLAAGRDSRTKPLVVTSRHAKKVVLQRSATGKQTTGIAEFSDFANWSGRVICTVTASADDPLLRWRLEASLPEGSVLEEVRFPILTLRPSSSAEPADALVLGLAKGGVYHQPSAWKTGRTIIGRQPGNLAAQFACTYDTTGGLLTATLDSQGHRKTLSATRTADGLQLAWWHSSLHTSSYKLAYDVAQTTFHSPDPARPTDWRDGADLYKQWAVQQPWCKRTFAAREDVPAWLKAGPAMVRFARQWLADPDSIKAWFNTYWRSNFPADTPLIITYWGWEKVEKWVGGEYFPAFPSDQAFEDLTRFGRSLGGHTFVWPSGYHYTYTYYKQPDGTFAWDGRARFEATAKAHVSCKQSGEPHTFSPYWIRGGEMAKLCPGDPWTIDWLNQIAVGAVQRGADMVQIDQVVGAEFPPCYSAAHGHKPGPGLWMTDVFHQQLETMLQACRQVNPEAVLGFEEPNEHFIQQVAIQDYRDWEAPAPAELASVYSYLYHEYLPLFQSNPEPGPEPVNHLQSACALVDGQLPHFLPDLAPDGGDFEVWGDNAPAGWTRVEGEPGRVYTGQAARDEKEHYLRRRSLRLANDSEGQTVEIAQTAKVTAGLQPGQTYRLSVWMKSTNVKQPNAIRLSALSGDKETGSWRIPMPQAASDWVRGEATFRLPQDAEQFRISLHLDGPGTVWIDNMVLEVVRPGGSMANVLLPGKPTDHTLMRQWVELFHGPGRPYLALGKMLHPPRLETETIEAKGRRFPAILHNAFEAADGSQAVVLVNATDTSRKATLTWHGEPRPLLLQPWEVRLVR